MPPHQPTPSIYGLLSRDGVPELRIEIFCESDLVAFRQSVVWSDHAVIGLGHWVHFISVGGTTVCSHDLGSYFGHLYCAPGYLLAASAACVHCFDEAGQRAWKSAPVGIDGVLVHDAGPPLVRGEGQWDPPGDWRPFALAADTGKLVEI